MTSIILRVQFGVKVLSFSMLPGVSDISWCSLMLRYSPVTSMMPRVQFDVKVLSFSMLMR